MPLPFIVAGAFIAGSLLSAKKVVASVVLIDRYKSRRGYRNGEGPFTPREGEFGMLVAADSKSQLGSFIAALAEQFPTLSQFNGKLFEITHTEAEDLREVSAPAIAVADKIINSRSKIAELIHEREVLLTMEPSEERNQQILQYTVGINGVDALLDEYQTDLAYSMRPITQWLTRFPEKRIKTPPAAVLPILTNVV